MIKNIINEIKVAESSALETRKNADTEARMIIENAVKNAKNICANATLEAEKKYNKKIEEAKGIAAGRIDENRKLSYENAAVMTEIAKNKIDIAVNLIIDSILSVE